MSSECLWQAYSTGYQTIYTLHYISLAWIVAHWIVDGLHLRMWAQILAAEDTLRSKFGPGGAILGMAPEFQGPWYFVVVGMAVLAVTLTWTCIVPWSTADGLNGLALVLIVEIMLIACAAWFLSWVVQNWLALSRYMKGFREEG